MNHLPSHAALAALMALLFATHTESAEPESANFLETSTASEKSTLQKAKDKAVAAKNKAQDAAQEVAAKAKELSADVKARLATEIDQSIASFNAMQQKIEAEFKEMQNSIETEWNKVEQFENDMKAANAAQKELMTAVKQVGDHAHAFGTATQTSVDQLIAQANAIHAVVNSIMATQGNANKLIIALDIPPLFPPLMAPPSATILDAFAVFIAQSRDALIAPTKNMLQETQDLQKSFGAFASWHLPTDVQTKITQVAEFHIPVTQEMIDTAGAAMTTLASVSNIVAEKLRDVSVKIAEKATPERMETLKTLVRNLEQLRIIYEKVKDAVETAAKPITATIDAAKTVGNATIDAGKTVGNAAVDAGNAVGGAAKDAGGAVVGGAKSVGKKLKKIF